MGRTVIFLFVVWSVICGTQAFFLASTTKPRWPSDSASRDTTTAVGAGRSCLQTSSLCWERAIHSSGGARRDRRGGACGALGMAKKKGGGGKKPKVKVQNRLEEVSDELASEPVELACPKTGDTLVCYAERIAVVGGERYLVAFPKDPAVAIAFDENGEVSPVPNDDPIMDELFPLAEACVADLGPGVTLLRTPTTLTVKGLNELVDATDKDVGEEGASGNSVDSSESDGGERDGEDEDEDEDEEADEVELLGEFLLEGEEFLIVRFLEPILILAKEQEQGRYVLIDEEEEQDAIPVVDEMLCADPSL